MTGSVQFMAQHSRAMATSGVLLGDCAVAQQSGMLVTAAHSCSLECREIPVSPLPVMIVKRTKAVNHFAIAMRRLY